MLNQEYKYEYIDEELDVISDASSVQDVFEEILINEVKERPCLWNQRIDLKYRGPTAIKKAWEQVGKALDVDPIICQKKWKNLKDTFRKKYKEEHTYVPSGSGALKKKENWKFYQSVMQFLIPTLEIRSTISNMAVTKSSSVVSTIPSPPLTAAKLPPSCSFYSTSNLTCPSPTQTLSSSDNHTCPSPTQTLSSSDNYKSSTRGSKRQRNLTDLNTHQVTNPLDELLLKEISRSPQEEDTFCQFLVSRLIKLDRKRYLKLTHTIMMEVMKIEEEEL